MEKRGLSALCFCAKESDARNIALIRVKKGRRINNHWFCVNTLNIYFYFMCMSVLPACMSMYHVWLAPKEATTCHIP